MCIYIIYIYVSPARRWAMANSAAVCVPTGEDLNTGECLHQVS